MDKFDKLCQENYDRIYKYILLRLKKKELTEDTVQNVFLIAYEKGTGFTEHPNPPAFLYTTAANLVHECIREYQKHETELLEDKILGKYADIYEQIERQEDAMVDEENYIEMVLQSLSDEKRKLYEEYYVSRKSMAEIAKIYGISQVSLRMRYVRLRREIKEIIKDTMQKFFREME